MRTESFPSSFESAYWRRRCVKAFHKSQGDPMQHKIPCDGHITLSHSHHTYFVTLKNISFNIRQILGIVCTVHQPLRKNQRKPSTLGHLKWRESTGQEWWFVGVAYYEVVNPRPINNRNKTCKIRVARESESWEDQKIASRAHPAVSPSWLLVRVRPRSTITVKNTAQKSQHKGLNDFIASYIRCQEFALC
jgi:hypothetical protein